MVSFNKCVICKQPKGTCKHTSAVVAKQHAAKKAQKKSGSWMDKVMGKFFKDAPIHVGLYTKPLGEGGLGPNPCQELSIAWDLSYQDAQGNELFKEKIVNQVTDQVAGPLLQFDPFKLPEQMEHVNKPWPAGPLMLTEEQKIEYLTIAKEWEKAGNLLQIDAGKIQDGTITADKMANNWGPGGIWSTLEATQAISRVTRKNQEAVELVISGLTPDEAEELMMKYKPAPKVLIAKSVMKDAPHTNSKYQPICIWNTESSTKPAFGPAPLYSTQLNTDGTLSCNCRGWTQGSAKSAGGRFCKHTKALADKAAEVFKKWKAGQPLGDEFETMDEDFAKRFGEPAPSGEKLLVAKRVIEL